MNFASRLRDMNACTEAIEWVKENDYNLQQAWRNCQRGDWMMWFASRMNVDHRKLTLAKVRQAKLVYHLMNDERSKKAVDVAEAYGLGKATREELDAAYAYASAAAYVYPAADAAAYTAAVYAADAAAAAADASASAPADAAAAAFAAAAAAFAAARRETIAKCADICRDILTDEILEQNKLNKKRNNNGLRKDIR